MPTDEDEDRRYEQQVEIFEVSSINSMVCLSGSGSTIRSNPEIIRYMTIIWGFPQVKLSITNLKMLQPVIIEGLQQIVKGYSGWEIVVAVAAKGQFDDWPQMGLYIRPHEIVDGLRRQFFPKEFQDLKYPGTRPGTVND
ncbi:MAG TPA: hypothetical protein VGH13_12655 [Xanthobacteraceae bacterium]|jgi:hypothetical protein